MSFSITTRGWERLVLISVAYACGTTLASLAMIIFMHHLPQYQPVLLLSISALVMLELGFAPRRSVTFSPFLLVWLLWLVERVILANYWLAVSAKLYPSVPLLEYQYPVAFSIQLMCSWLSLVVPGLRSGNGVLFLSVVFSAAVVAQWSPVQSEQDTVLQAAAFSLLYMLAMVVTERLVKYESMNRSAVCVIQSAWCLWSLNPIVLVVAAAFQCMAGMAILASEVPRPRARKEKDSESAMSEDETE